MQYVTSKIINLQIFSQLSIGFNFSDFFFINSSKRKIKQKNMLQL